MHTTLLFVYGTLKTGMPAHHLLQGQEFRGPDRTIEQYRLYDLGPYPGLVQVSAAGVAVQGELWAIDSRTVAILDDYEDAPELFSRRAVILQHCFDPVEAYCYNRPVPPATLWADRWPFPA